MRAASGFGRLTHGRRPGKRPRAAAVREDVLTERTETGATYAPPPPAALGAARRSAVTEAPADALSLALASLEDDKAEDVVVIDLRGKSAMADAMIIASGRSARQVAAIAEKLADRYKERFRRPARSEGKGQGDWVLIDLGDVIVHVFRPEVREFYQLEKMWMDPAALRARAAARPLDRNPADA